MDLTADSIAIVGVGGRFPRADDLDAFWRLLLNGENHVKDIPLERWHNDVFYDSDVNAKGKSYVKKAGLMQNHDVFDNRFFGINDKEAESMDPQQHYVLECTHMALENGGFTRSRMAGSKTAVYIGLMNQDYGATMHDDLTRSTSYSVTGQSASIVAARVSYVYDLHGPAMTVDTACSSSLVAVHLGAQAIATGDCEMAICGGVNSLLLPNAFVQLSRARMLSPSGQSQAFSQTADGYARGEGCGIVILKKLGQAVRDRDSIWAVLGTGCNQDGRGATPITSPCKLQQERLLHDVYSKHNLDPRAVSYIEAHGTGTPVRDPIEVDALGKFFAAKDRSPLFIGSVKTNIGHLESAAGMAGLIKTLLMIKHQKYVPTILFSDLNSRIDFAGYGLSVCTDLSDWKVSPGTNRIACVNSFGFGGTNSHVNVQEWCVETAEKVLSPNEPVKEIWNESQARVVGTGMTTKRSAQTPASFTPPAQKVSIPCKPTQNGNNNMRRMPKKKHVVILSAPSKETLGKTVQDFFERLEDESCQYNIEDLSYTSTLRRDVYAYRLAVFASDLEQLLQMKNQLMAEAQRAVDSSQKKPRLVFLFCGVGTTWQGMCKNLIDTSAVFKSVVDRVDKLLERLDNTFSISTMLKTGGDISDPMYAHLAIFTSQVALFELWKRFGVSPDAIVGQSVGEVAAAYGAGILNLEDAVKIIYHRSRLLRQEAEGKMMVITKCAVEIVERHCSYLDEKATIAVYSSPTACTVSGDIGNLEELKKNIMEEATQSGISSPTFYVLHVQCAYHSHHVDKAATGLMHALDGLQGNTCKFPIVSTVTGRLAKNNDFTTAQYWQRNVRSPVLLHQALTTAASLCRSKDTDPVIVLELGPRPVLRAHVGNIFSAFPVTLVPSMLPGREPDTFTKAVTDLFQLGVSLNISECQGQSGRLTNIPRYPFHRQKTLSVSQATRAKLDGKPTEASEGCGHPFVVRNHKDSSEFFFKISPGSTPFVYDHVVSGTIVVQGATFGEIGLSVAQMTWNLPAHLLEMHLIYEKIITLRTGESVTATVNTLTRNNNDTIEFTIRTKSTMHARGTVKKRFSGSAATLPNIRAVQARCESLKDEKSIYEDLEKTLKITFGKTTRVLKSAFYNENECVVEVHVPAEIQKQLWRTSLHPCLLDAMAQASILLPTQDSEVGVQLWLPASIDKVIVHRCPEPDLLIYLKCGKQTAAKRYYSGLLLTRSGELVAQMVNLLIENKSSRMLDMNENMNYEIVWKRMFTEIVPAPPGHTCEFLLMGIDKAATDECEKALRKHNVKSYTSVDKLEEYLRSISREQQLKVRAILFCYPRKVDLQNPQTANQWMQDICWMFITLVQRLSKMALDIRLCVVTYNCQIVDQTHLPDTPMEPAGSTLWGMARSMIQEFAHHRLHLFDLTEVSPPELGLLRAFLCGETSLSLDTLSEIKIQGEQVFECEFAFRERVQDAAERKLFNDGTCPLQLVTKNKDQIQEITCRIMSLDTDNVNSTVQIHVESAFLHEKAIYPTMQISAHLYEESKYREINVFEIVGRVMRTGDHITDVCVGDFVVALYPLTLATVVEVPAPAVMKVEYPQHYQVGTAFNAHLLSALAENSRAENMVVVFHSQDTAQHADTFRKALRHQKHCVVESVVVARNVHPPETADEAVLLEDIEPEVLAEMFSGMRNLKHVLFPRHLMTDQSKTFMRCSFPHLDFSEVGFQAELSPRKLMGAMASLKSWLRTAQPSDGASHHRECLKIEHKQPVSAPECAVVLNVDSLSRGATHVLPQSSDKVLLKSGAYMVTGGNSGLGWEIAKMLATGGAGMVVCISRTNPTEELRREMSGLGNQCGCQLISEKCDVSDMDSLLNMLERMNRKIKGKLKLRGVFHCAAVFDDALLIRMTERSVHKVFQPKVLGTLNLHQCTMSIPLDFFVVSSSVAAVLGNHGQTSYSAANCFQDAMMFLRRQMGLEGQTINWGALNLGILSKDQKTRHQLVSQGWKLLEVDEIHLNFTFTLQQNRIQSIYCKVNWEKALKVVQSYGRHAPYVQKYKAMMAEIRLLQMYETNSNDNPMFAVIPEGQPEMQTYTALQAVRMTMSEIFMLDEAPLDIKVFDLQVDSMLVLAFIDRISKLTGILLPMGMLFDQETTLGQIVEYLKEKEINGSETSTNVPQEDAEQNDTAEVSTKNFEVTKSQKPQTASQQLEKPWKHEEHSSIKMQSSPPALHVSATSTRILRSSGNGSSGHVQSETGLATSHSVISGRGRSTVPQLTQTLVHGRVVVKKTKL